MSAIKEKLNEVDWVKNPDELKRKIIDAASIIYAKKSFTDASLQEISDLASVNRTVTRHYVKNESEIMRLIMEDMLFYFKESIIKATKDIDDLDKKIAAAIETYIRCADDQRDKVLIVYQSSKYLNRDSKTMVKRLEVDVSNIFVEIIREGIDIGVFKMVDVDLMAYNVLLIAHMWVLKRWHFKNRLSIEEYINLQLDFIMAALIK